MRVERLRHRAEAHGVAVPDIDAVLGEDTRPALSVVPDRPVLADPVEQEKILRPQPRELTLTDGTKIVIHPLSAYNSREFAAIVSQVMAKASQLGSLSIGAVAGIVVQRFQREIIRLAGEAAFAADKGAPDKIVAATLTINEHAKFDDLAAIFGAIDKNEGALKVIFDRVAASIEGGKATANPPAATA